MGLIIPKSNLDEKRNFKIPYFNKFFVYKVAVENVPPTGVGLIVGFKLVFFSVAKAAIELQMWVLVYF